MTHGTMMLMPPAPHLCQSCGSDHEPHLPHNAQSLYYGVAFQMEHGRSPNWLDAMDHCSDEMKALWRAQLIDLGVDVDSGQVSPPRKRKARP